MTQNEIENRLVERAEQVILRENAESVLQKIGGQFTKEKDLLDDLVEFKKRVVLVY
jgi:hypothetical protein